MSNYVVEHLLSDELAYELTVRGYTPLETVIQNRQALRGVIRMESRGQSFTLPSYTLDPEREVTVCEEKVNEMENLLRNASEAQLVRYNSRISHLTGRVERIPITPPLVDSISRLKIRIACLVDRLANPEVNVEARFNMESVKEEIENDFSPRANVSAPNRVSDSRVPRLDFPVTRSTPVRPPEPVPRVADVFDLEYRPPVTSSRMMPNITTVRAEMLASANFRENTVRSQPVSQWNLRFNGSNLSLTTFLERIEDLRRARHVNEQQLLDQAVDLFEGDALIWYRYHRSKFTTWNALVKQLKVAFLRDDYDIRLREEIYARTQGVDEKFDIYIAIMGAMFERLTELPSEEERLRVIMRNLLPIYQQHLALYEPRSLEDLLSLGRKLESTHRRMVEIKPPPRAGKSTLEPELSYRETVPRRGVHAVEIADPEVSEVKTTIRGTCWNCLEKGHFYPACKKPRKKFCFKCGKPDFIVKNCPSCSPKNGETADM